MEISKGRGRGVSRVDIYANRLETVESARDTIWGYWSDGRGDLRVRQNYSKKYLDYEYRIADKKRWRRLHREKPDDIDDKFWPLGFGDDPAELFVWDAHEGRAALYSLNLGETVERRLIYAHPEVDLSGYERLGKYRRIIGVAYSTDHVPTSSTSTRRSRRIVERLLEQEAPDQIMGLDVLSESWDRRFYLVHVGSDVESGRYYRFDTKTGELAMITKVYPGSRNTSLRR